LLNKAVIIQSGTAIKTSNKTLKLNQSSGHAGGQQTTVPFDGYFSG